MKKKNIIISNNENVLYRGGVMDIPIKEMEIINGCVKTFDDDDPCILHRTYVINNYNTDFFKEFKQLLKKDEVVFIRSFSNTIIKRIDLEGLEGAIINYE